ncbi:MAG: hypothetical protein WDN04_28270 [Rhodospirillales bacterium]
MFGSVLVVPSNTNGGALSSRLLTPIVALHAAVRVGQADVVIENLGLARVDEQLRINRDRVVLHAR